MRLLLVRHAIAEDPAPGRPDAARALTDAGRAQFRRRALPELERFAPFERLIHSPWRRAAETAELLGALLAHGATRCADVRLAAPPDAAALAALAGERVVAVGHQPWLAELAALACFGDASLGAQLSLRKGGALLLDGEPTPRGMRLLALLRPRKD